MVNARCRCALLALLSIATVGDANESDRTRGKLLYEAHCASCHGLAGEGVPDAYADPLAGPHSVTVLARLIERTMPEGEPELCEADDAQAVAEYIHQSFYSVAARRRNGLLHAPRIELVRLTVPQFRNAVADLIDHFSPFNSGEKGADGATSEAKPGLRAEYYQSKGMSKADQLRRSKVDTHFSFDFGEASPDEEIEPDQFAIIWEGSFLAEHTGRYELRVRTPNGARLYLNNDSPEQRRKLRDDSSVAGQAALIDAWVSSGKLREREASLFLLGGRRYPIRIEFFKYKEAMASLQVEYKPPHGVWSTLDAQSLTTARSGRLFVLDTPFPADDRSAGYERGSSVSKQWHEATTMAALTAADEVINRLPLLMAGADPDDLTSAQEFVLRFARAAYGRPLTADEDHLYRHVLFHGVTDNRDAVRKAVLVTLKSPRFLYDNLPAAHADSFRLARQLALTLWDSIPNPNLLELAAQPGAFATQEQVAAVAQQMIDDPRCRAKLGGFFERWLELDERDHAKDRELFPEFDASVVADLRRSLTLFIDHVVWSEASDYRELLLADYLMLNRPLRELYAHPHGTAASDGAEPVERTVPHADLAFSPQTFAPQHRAGVLTHPYLLSAFAYHNATSPIHRGVFLTRNIVGRHLKPPPVAVAFKDDEFPAELTMREKITMLTRDSACQSCHSVINPLGFALENFDALGRWRDEDNDRPVDSTSEYVTVTGDRLRLGSARDIAEYAACNESAHRAFVTQLFEHLVKQNPTAFGDDGIERLRIQFQQDNFHIRNLVAQIALRAIGCDE